MRRIQVCFFFQLIWIAVPAAVIAGADPTPQSPAKVISGGDLLGVTTWSGTVAVDQEITVVPEAELRLEAGTTVIFSGAKARLIILGKIIGNGTEANPVRFVGQTGGAESSLWGGVTIKNYGLEAVFRNAVFEGAATAAAVSESKVVFENCRFLKNTTAVEAVMDAGIDLRRCLIAEGGSGIIARLRAQIDMDECRFEKLSEFALVVANDAKPTVRRSVFKGGKGVLCKQTSWGRIEECVFEKCLVGLALDQAGKTFLARHLVFEGAETGIHSFNLSAPMIRCCTFRNSKTGLLVQKYSTPEVSRCLFEKNEDALYATQKCLFAVNYNQFSDNKRAIVLDYSSYPIIKWNNFSGNVTDIFLEKSMSADWEKRRGSRQLTLEQGAMAGSRNMDSLAGPIEFRDVVAAEHNWWGEKTTAEMEKKGKNADITTIDDAHDRPKVSYPGFGEGEYALDRVSYDFWEKRPIPDAGPAKDGCLETQVPEGGNR